MVNNIFSISNKLQAQNSTCLNQAFSILQENRYCTPCVHNKTVPNMIFKEKLHKLKTPPALKKNFTCCKKTNTTHHACVPQQSPI